MKAVFLIFLLIPFCGASQVSIQKMSNTIVLSVDDPVLGLKKVAKKMIKQGYDIEKDFDLGYIKGVLTEEAKGWKMARQLKIQVLEENGLIYLSGDFSLFPTRLGDFDQFDEIIWKGGKKGAWKIAFRKMEELIEGIGEIKYLIQ